MTIHITASRVAVLFSRENLRTLRWIFKNGSTYEALYRAEIIGEWIEQIKNKGQRKNALAAFDRLIKQAPSTMRKRDR
jgi:hypothetical protein